MWIREVLRNYDSFDKRYFTEAVLQNNLFHHFVHLLFAPNVLFQRLWLDYKESGCLFPI